MIRASSIRNFLKVEDSNLNEQDATEAQIEKLHDLNIKSLWVATVSPSWQAEVEILVVKKEGAVRAAFLSEPWGGINVTFEADWLDPVEPIFLRPDIMLYDVPPGLDGTRYRLDGLWNDKNKPLIQMGFGVQTEVC